MGGCLSTPDGKGEAVQGKGAAYAVSETPKDTVASKQSQATTQPVQQLNSSTQQQQQQQQQQNGKPADKPSAPAATPNGTGAGSNAVSHSMKSLSVNEASAVQGTLLKVCALYVAMHLITLCCIILCSSSDVLSLSYVIISFTRHRVYPTLATTFDCRSAH